MINTIATSTDYVGSYLIYKKILTSLNDVKWMQVDHKISMDSHIKITKKETNKICRKLNKLK